MVSLLLAKLATTALTIERVNKILSGVESTVPAPQPVPESSPAPMPIPTCRPR